MPLIVNMVSGNSYLVEGEAAPAKPWKPGRVIESRNMKTGHAITIQLSAIAVAELWPQAEYDAEQKARADAEEAERKRNPNPGREPRILVPRKPS